MLPHLVIVPCGILPACRGGRRRPERHVPLRQRALAEYRLPAVPFPYGAPRDALPVAEPQGRGRTGHPQAGARVEACEDAGRESPLAHVPQDMGEKISQCVAGEERIGRLCPPETPERPPRPAQGAAQPLRLPRLSRMPQHHEPCRGLAEPGHRRGLGAPSGTPSLPEENARVGHPVKPQEAERKTNTKVYLTRRLLPA